MLGFFNKRQHSGLRGLLSAYIDDETTELEASRVEAHLAVCAECRAELESLRDTVSLLRSFPEYELPRSFVLTQAPAPVRAAAPKVVWTARLATSFAGILLLALVLGDAFGIVTQSSTGVDEQQRLAAPAGPPGQPGLADLPEGGYGISPERYRQLLGTPAPTQPPQPQAPTAPQAPSQAAPAMPLQPAAAAATPTSESEAPPFEMFAPSPPAAGATADASAGASEPQMGATPVPDEAEKAKLSSASAAQPTPAPDAGLGITGVAPTSEGSQAEAPQPGQEAAPADGPVIALMQDDDGAEEDARLAEIEDANPGLALPLWQLEVAAGAALLVLAAATIWTTRRGWRA
ncbi:MAG: zf-HC2 domain-containing protein [Chloroflexi bacterium]|nr:zf-HC2 domain-containing protein [Chloroflexota bacterium]